MYLKFKDCLSRFLLLGFCAWILLVVAALVTYKSDIEDDLIDRSIEMGVEQSSEPFAVYADGRDLSLQCLNPDEHCQQLARDIEDQVFGVRVVDLVSTPLDANQMHQMQASYIAAKPMLLDLPIFITDNRERLLTTRFEPEQFPELAKIARALRSSHQSITVNVQSGVYLREGDNELRSILAGRQVARYLAMMGVDARRIKVISKGSQGVVGRQSWSEQPTVIRKIVIDTWEGV
ncbi:MAG: hypothetical protein HWE20_03740 [Gammaproteobacteria bacterium]|nr:hypothetical protein [Gammaproteobacteria bacterium]